MYEGKFQGPGGGGIRWHPSPSSGWVADYLSASSSRPPREVEDPVDWTLRGRRLQARAMGDALVKSGHALGRLVAGVWNALTRRHREREAIRALSALDDHLLRDIGIRRSEIPLVVRGHIRAQPLGAAAEVPGRSAGEVAAGIDQDRLAA